MFFTAILEPFWCFQGTSYVRIGGVDTTGGAQVVLGEREITEES